MKDYKKIEKKIGKAPIEVPTTTKGGVLLESNK